MIRLLLLISADVQVVRFPDMILGKVLQVLGLTQLMVSLNLKMSSKRLSLNHESSSATSLIRWTRCSNF